MIFDESLQTAELHGARLARHFTGLPEYDHGRDRTNIVACANRYGDGLIFQLESTTSSKSIPVTKFAWFDN